MTACPRVGKLFGGCKWSPRYDTHKPSFDPSNLISYDGPVEALQSRKTYLGDVCTRCGDARFRRKSGPGKPASTGERG